MKKLLLVLCALLAGVSGVKAQPDVTGKSFTLNCARGYVYFDGSVLAGTTDATQASEFAIVTYNSETYLYDATQKAFVCHTTAAQAGTTGNASLESNDDFSKAVKGLTWGNTEIATYPYYLADCYGNWLNMDGSPKVYFNTWKNFESGNGGNTYNVAIVNEAFDATEAIAMLDAYFNPSATVKYVISDANGVIYTSEASPATIGETISALPADLQRPYCTYNVTSATIVLGENTVNATVAYNPPFTVSSSFDAATWYYATLRGSKYLRADDNAKDGNGRYKTSTTNEKTDVYKWAFVGNPYCLYIINKGQGNNKCLYAGDVPSMQEASPASDVKARWIVSSNSNGGFNVRSESGANLYINDASGAGNLGFWNSSWATSDNGSNWVITEVPATAVDVTYNLVVGGGVVKSVVDGQVAANSEVNIPASLISDYSALAYNFTTVGTIGNENCTISVIPALKSGVVTNIYSNLSNNKAYTLNTTRGTLGTNGTQMVSTNGTSYDASNFAIINYKDNYYLYSVEDSKWVGNPQTIAGVANQPALTDDLSNVTSLVFDAANATETSPLFFMGMGNNGVNVSNYATGIVVNSWTTRDAGNQYCIIEAADFDPTAALAALNEYFSGPTQYAQAIEQLRTINFGTSLNQYSFTGTYAGYTAQAADIITGLETQGYSADNLAIAQDMLNNYELNMPAAGFYRIKGQTSGAYLASGMASNNKFAMSYATDASTIFYFDGNTLVNYGSGLSNGMTASNWAWVTTENASTVVFQDGLTNGGYGIKSATANFYDNGTSADRGGNVTINSSTNARYTNWYLEAVNTLPVSVTDAGYATFYAPVAVTIPTGVTAYTGVINTNNSNYFTLNEVVNTIPANTAVILKGAANNYSFAITTSEKFSGSNDLQGTIGGKTDVANSILTLQNIDEVGLYIYTGATLAGFKAYLPKPANDVKGLTFDFETAIKAIDAAQNADEAVFDLSGRRVQKAVKGLYIVNGKKVVK